MAFSRLTKEGREMRFQMTFGLMLLALGGLVPGCDDDNVGEAGCEDLVRTFGDVAVRCGFDRDVNEDAVESSVTGGLGCEAVVSLRDADAFYDSCIPFIDSLTCAQFDDPDLTVPSSCSMQLER